MALADLPIISMLKQRMSWLTERQQVLAQNVANANTPGYQARDLQELDFGKMVKRDGLAMAPVATSAAHIGRPVGGQSLGAAKGGVIVKAADHETTPGGNSVVLEDQMIKVAETQSDYEMVTGLYAKSLGLLRMAVTSQG